MMHQKKQIKISDIVIPKYLEIFNDKRHKHIILTSGRAGTKSSFVAIRAEHQLISDPSGSVVVLRGFSSLKHVGASQIRAQTCVSRQIDS